MTNTEIAIVLALALLVLIVLLKLELRRVNKDIDNLFAMFRKQHQANRAFLLWMQYHQQLQGQYLSNPAPGKAHTNDD